MARVRLSVDDEEIKFPDHRIVEVTRFPDGSVFVGVKDGPEHELRQLRHQVFALRQAIVCIDAARPAEADEKLHEAIDSALAISSNS